MADENTDVPTLSPASTEETSTVPPVVTPPPPAPAPEPLIQAEPDPVFDPSKPHGEIYGSAGADGVTARYVQGGHYFAPNGKYISSEAGARNVAVAKASTVTPTPADRSLTAEEMGALLADPRAAALLDQPLDQLAALTAEHGGPSFSGENAARWYVAWLLKYAVKS